MTRAGASILWIAAALALMGLVPTLPAAAPTQVASVTSLTTPPPEFYADKFMTDPRLGETRALLVLKDGKIVLERYAPGYGPANRFISWSMAKSVTSTLVGQLVGEGRLKLDAPAPVPEWQDKSDPRGKITLEQLIHMASGLEHSESSGKHPEDPDTNRALFGDRARDTVAAAKAKPLAYAPGTHFQYSTLTSVMLADIVQRTAAPAATPEARKRAMRAWMLDRLIRPAGLTSLVCDFDPAGTMMGGSLCYMTARDWARFGQLYLDGGKVGAVQVVPPDWVRFVRTPSKLDHAYGGQFWLNLPRPRGKDAALFPEAGPADAFSAIGHLGQYVLVVPSKHLVVVRLGKTQDDKLSPVRKGLARLVNAYPDVP